MTTLARINLCHGCVHLDRSGGVDAQPSCDAFTVIPPEIWRGGDHRTPVDGDGGVVFEEMINGTVAVWEAFNAAIEGQP